MQSAHNKNYHSGRCSARQPSLSQQAQSQASLPPVAHCGAAAVAPSNAERVSIYVHHILSNEKISQRYGLDAGRSYIEQHEHINRRLRGWLQRWLDGELPDCMAAQPDVY